MRHTGENGYKAKRYDSAGMTKQIARNHEYNGKIRLHEPKAKKLTSLEQKKRLEVLEKMP